MSFKFKPTTHKKQGSRSMHKSRLSGDIDGDIQSNGMISVASQKDLMQNFLVSNFSNIYETDNKTDMNIYKHTRGQSSIDIVIPKSMDTMNNITSTPLVEDSEDINYNDILSNNVMNQIDIEEYNSSNATPDPMDQIHTNLNNGNNNNNNITFPDTMSTKSDKNKKISPIPDGFSPFGS